VYLGVRQLIDEVDTYKPDGVKKEKGKKESFVWSVQGGASKGSGGGKAKTCECNYGKRGVTCLESRFRKSHRLKNQKDRGKGIRR